MALLPRSSRQIRHVPALPALVALLSALLAAAPARAAECPSFVSASQGLPTAGEWRTHPAIGDVNGDGHLDLAGLPRKGRGPAVFLGDGKGRWKPSSEGLIIPGFSCGVGVDLGDANGDGHPDLVAADHCNGLFVFLGDGKGAWKLVRSVMRGEQAGFDDARFVDFDGDGKLDVVAAGSFRGGISIFKGDGTGKFVERRGQDTGLPEVGQASDLDLADVDGDGTLDIAAAYTGGIMNPPPREIHRNVLWVSEAPGKYRPATPNLFFDGRVYGVSLGDVNGDRRGDIALSRDRDAPLQVYLGQQDGSWLPAQDGLPAPNSGRFYGLELTDVNGDGKLDLVAVDHALAGLALWLGDGTGKWQACPDSGLPTTRPGQRGWGVAVRDVNGDGLPDISAGFGRDGAGSLEVWVQKPSGASPASKRPASAGK